MRVLVVEADPVLAQTLLESLQAHDFEATNARSSQEAWEVLWSRAFDVLVLDVMLPEGTDQGFLLAGQIREAGFRQPILFLTARENLTDRVRGLR